MRHWLQLPAALILLVVATMVPPLAAYVLIIAAFALVLDSATKLFEQSHRGGRLTDHRQ